MELTHSLEDYLEAIFIISNKKKVVRVKDIMDYFNYKVSSVNKAIKALKGRGLVWHEKYEYIELTPQGLALAEKVYEKHKFLIRFFNQILKVPDELAVKEGCNVEHYISDQTFKRLYAFVEFIETRYPNVLKNWFDYLESEGGNPMTRLSDLNVGEEGIIKKITALPGIKRKLLSMGLTPGERITVERKAPLGDPIEVRVKGYSLSLRKEEAEGVLIERGK